MNPTTPPIPAAPVARLVDARGRSCPMPIVELARAAKQCAAGDHIEILATDAAFPADVEAWCRKTKHELLSVVQQGTHYCAIVRTVSP